jgi:hypothetical protein
MIALLTAFLLFYFGAAWYWWALWLLVLILALREV